jgi:Domain of unknown function (DUF4417)
MVEQAALFQREEGPLCAGCRWFQACGAARTEFACADKWGASTLGGQEVLHPGFQTTHELMDLIGGPDFDIPLDGAVNVPNLPPFVPPVEIRSDLSGNLDSDVYFLTTKDVVGRRMNPLSAEEVRSRLQLTADQKLGLLLFGKDDWVERLWNERSRLVPELAAGGFDFIGGPSYSTYVPRPRPEYFWATKRSLITVSELQQAGAPAIPRVAWITPYDALRFAYYLNQCPLVRHVVIDWTGSRSTKEWNRQLSNLGYFDRATSRRLVYVINGPSRLDRVVELFEVVDPKRICLTGSVLAQPPHRGAKGQTSSTPTKLRIFRRGISLREEMIREARARLGDAVVKDERREAA